MILELHILQTYPTNRLNRGEDGAPKSMVFGGVPRVRVSSQAQKRAERTHPFLGFPVKAVRSKHIEQALHTLLEHESSDLAHPRIQEAVRTAVQEVFGAFDAKGRLKVSVVAGEDELERLRDLLAPGLPAVLAAGTEVERTEIIRTLVQPFRAGTVSPDVALYGRLLIDADHWDVDGAAYYSHAFSTHRSNQLTDFFSAIDDVTGDTVHIGNMELTAPTLYRTAILDLNQLRTNLPLASDAERLSVARTWAQRAVQSVPGGGRTGAFAATLPDYVLVVSRTGQPLSLAAAFETPVRRQDDQSIGMRSALELEQHLQHLHEMYGDRGLRAAGTVSIHTLPPGEPLAITRHRALDAALTAALTP